jgi:hypothetical protein
MHDEMESLENNGTHLLFVKLPKEKKPLRCKWGFKRLDRWEFLQVMRRGIKHG